MKIWKFIDVRVVTLGLVLTGCEMGGEDDLDESVRAGESVDVEADVESEKNKPDDESCKLNDVWEPNPSAEQATPIAWEDPDPSDGAVGIGISAYLCAGEDDWYRFDTDSIDYENPWLTVLALIEGAGPCGGNCGDPVIKEGPKHAMTIELYRADTMQLISSGTGDMGVIGFELRLDLEGTDLLIHVFSPTHNAKYSYDLFVSYADGPPGDTCEC